MFLFKKKEENCPMFEVHLLETPNLPSDTPNQANLGFVNHQSASNLDQMIPSDGSSKTYQLHTEKTQNSFCDIQVPASPVIIDFESTSDVYQMIQSDESSKMHEDTPNSQGPNTCGQANSDGTIDLQSTNDSIQMIDVSSTTSSPKKETKVPKKVQETHKSAKSRMIRRQFSSEQLLVLQMEFEKGEYISRKRRSQLSQSLKLTETQITVWFQNRRTRIKKKGIEIPRKAAKVPKRLTKQSKSKEALGNQNNSNGSVDITSYLDDNMPLSPEEDVDWYLNNFQSYLGEMES